MANQNTAEPVHLLSITGLFPDYDAADKAYHYLTELGYDQDHIVVILPDSKAGATPVRTTESNIRTDAQHGPEPSATGVEKSTKATEGLTVGASIGALAGAVALIGTSIILPGLGLAFLGTLTAGAVGAGGGAAIGGLAGLLYGSGIPETELPYYQSGIQSGKVLVGVTPRTTEDAERISTRWKELGATLRPG